MSFMVNPKRNPIADTRPTTYKFIRTKPETFSSALKLDRISDLTDPIVLANRIEYYKKDKLQHLKWLYSNIDTIKSNVVSKGKNTNEIEILADTFKKKYEDLFDPKSRVIETESTKRRKTPSMDNNDREEQICLNKNYNKSAIHNRPYPESTNQLYGWYVNFATPDYTTVQRGKRNNLKSMFERSGLTPDPEHYKQAEMFFK